MRTTLHIAALMICLTAPMFSYGQDFVPFDSGPDTVADPAPSPEASAAASDSPDGVLVNPLDAEGADDEDEGPRRVEETPAIETPPEAPQSELGTRESGGEQTPQAGQGRLVEEKQIEERVEAIGASALAPSTIHNRLETPSNERPSPSKGGAIGLHQMHTARAGAPGSVRLSLSSEYFSYKDFLILGDRSNRQSATFGVSMTPLSWLETYANISYTSTSNSLSSPSLLQVQGDSQIGAKAVYTASRAFSLGLDLQFGLFPPIGEVGLGAVGFTPRALLAFDARGLAPKVPIITHLELGLFLDGTGGLPGGLSLTRVEEFALGIHRYNRFGTGVGLEIPLPYVTPTLEWRLRAPLGQVVLPQVTDNGQLRTLSYNEVLSQTLGFGLRVTAIRDLSFLLDFELGLSGAAIAGVPATLPWNFVFGVSYTLDPLSKAERVTRVMQRTMEIEKPIETRPPAGVVEGVVRQKGDQTILSGVLIRVLDQDDPPVASAMETGRYRSRDLAPGQVTLVAEKEGYVPARSEAVIADKAVTPLDFELEKLILTGTLELQVTDTKSKKGLVAQVSIQGPSESEEAKQLATSKGGKGSVELDPGSYRVTVTSPKHNARQKDLSIENGAKIILDLELSPKAARKLIIVRKKQIQVKRQVHFLTGKASIMQDSYQLLDQVIDAVVSNKIEKLRIEGHTDSQGADSANLRLSQARADAVRAYFIEKGIGENRIEARGFGETRPIAPNLTQRGRAMNRRVEFHIVEKE